MNSLRVYATGTNLITWQRYTGYSPEIANTNYRQRYATDAFTGNVLDANIDRGIYPIAKSWVFGVDVRF
jgi:hypothetical protein